MRRDIAEMRAGLVRRNLAQSSSAQGARASWARASWAQASWARASWARRLFLALSVADERRALARLSPRELADIGLSDAQARQEAARPIWDLPAKRF